MENLVFEEFERYSQYFNYEKLRDKTFLITGAKGFLASSTIRFLLYLNNKFDLNLYIYGTSRDTNIIPDYINKDDAIKYIKFENFDKATYDKKIDYIVCENLEDATHIAYNNSNEGDVILLSPACASWDQFDNFEIRGDLFKKVVNELK